MVTAVNPFVANFTQRQYIIRAFCKSCVYTKRNIKTAKVKTDKAFFTLS